MFSAFTQAKWLHVDYTLDSFTDAFEKREVSSFSKTMWERAKSHVAGIYFGYRNERLSMIPINCILPESVDIDELVDALFNASNKDRVTFYPKQDLVQSLRYVLFKRC